ncbi:FecR family protein [Fodinibius sediminis]|uniref:FecR family protein n=1 Tax=Fodinibius sediminis TaxID=1214077 RepID=A0A521CJ24_9BACT|nr:FecR domain-containing protein [Fodinibius sediminis]SMO58690.1 FecR family protein [Fodinibius sediminis]
MNKVPREKNEDASSRGDFFAQFPPDDRNRMKEIWELSADAGPPAPHSSEQEVESALLEVHGRIRTGGRPLKRAGQGKKNGWTKVRWWLAAAVVLLVFGAGLLLKSQTISVPRGELATVTLPDGSTVELNSGSQLWYSRLFGYTNRTVHLDGEAFFEVKEGGSPFIVSTQQSVVRVTGTQFNIRSWSLEPSRTTEVTVTEGRVRFYPEDLPEHSVMLREGEFSSWSENMKQPLAPRSVSVDNRLGWRKQKLMFNEQPLVVIFQELERRFDVDIELTAPHMAGETLSAFYARPKHVETVLKDICRVKGLRYSRTANGYRVYK